MTVLHVCADLGMPELGGKDPAVHVRAMTRAPRETGHADMLVAGRLVTSPWETPAERAVPVVHGPPRGDHAAALVTAS